jgi:putative PIN family toxin of toxin-antitoxin system
MFDSNILISAAFFPNARTELIFDYISSRHEIVLSDVITQELLEVAAYDRFNKVDDMAAYLNGLSYTEFISPPVEYLENLYIRDPDDYPILFAAVKSGVDVFITGDKDFLECGVSDPRIMTLTEFQSEFMHP